MTTRTETVTLAAGELEAEFAPERGMVATSLRHAGDELLDVDAGRGGIVGIPLLHPWANRLAAHDYTIDGRTVDLHGAPLQCEEHGLPIHGLLAGSPLWEVTAHGPAAVRAQLDFDGELLEAFPFAHRLAIVARLGRDRLTITTTVTGPRPVPIAFGFHPYLRLPGAPREDWVVSLPPRRHLRLDARAIPTGGWQRRPASVFPLGTRAFDDGYDALVPGAAFSVEGGGRAITVTLEQGYPAAQVYSPRDAPFICFEPMTAPTNALRSGHGLRRASAFTATFSVQIKPSSRARPTA